MRAILTITTLAFMLASYILTGVTCDGDVLLAEIVKEPEDPGDGDDTTEFRSTTPDSSGPVEIIKGTADCSCGQQKVEARIVGGTRAKINELPWTAAIANKGMGLSFCGATLISNKYVATAAHCMTYVGRPEEIEVLLMEQDFEVETETAQPTLRIAVAEIIKHPEYNHKKMLNDITLLKLATPVSISREDPNAMAPACLPANNNVSFAGMVATVAGWGATSYGRHSVSKLRKVDVPIFTQEVCKTQTRYTKVLKEMMMCAGFLEGQKDACSGDSGGPLVIRQSGQYVLCGLVSFGFNCAQPKAPGVYTRLGWFADWIRQNTQDSEYCSN